MWKQLFRQRIPLSLLLTKNEKTNVDYFLNFCWSVACLLQNFIILRRQKSIHILLLFYFLRLSLFFQTTRPLFFFLDIRIRVECKTVLFNLFVIAELLMYFRFCHGIATNKNLNDELLVRKSNILLLHFKKQLNISTNKQLLQVSLLTITFTSVNLMLLGSKPYDHILQLSTITCRHSDKLQQYSADFPSLSSTNSDFELTLTLIINTDLLSVPTTRMDSNLSEY